MNGKIVLRGREVGIRSAEGKRFLVDSARAAEGILGDVDLCARYELSYADLEAAIANKTFKDALAAKRIERVRDGTATKELAAQHIIERPKTADSIMVAGGLQDEIECEVKTAGSTKNGESAFRTFIADSLKEERREMAPPIDIKMLPAGRLLGWLENFWSKPTISAREIMKFGPRPIKNSKETMSATKILIEQGWLFPIRTRQHNSKAWRIIRGTNEQMKQRALTELLQLSLADTPTCADVSLAGDRASHEISARNRDAITLGA